MTGSELVSLGGLAGQKYYFGEKDINNMKIQTILKNQNLANVDGSFCLNLISYLTNNW